MVDRMEESKAGYEENSRNSSLTMDEDKRFFLDKDTSFKTTPRRRWMNWRTIGSTCNIVLFLTGISIWSQAVMVLKSKCVACDSKVANWNDFEEDLLFNSRVTFQPRWALVEPPNNITDKIWESFTPPGEGIVEIPNEATVGLPATKKSAKNPNTHSVYGISMFHQIHCVNLLRINFYPDALAEYYPNDDREMIIKHRDHCIDYLQQAIACHGDVTFEPWTADGVNGMGAVHECRDYDKLFTWAYEQRYEKEKTLFDREGKLAPLKTDVSGQHKHNH